MAFAHIDSQIDALSSFCSYLCISAPAFVPTYLIAALLSPTQAARNHTNRKAQSLQRDLDKRLRDSRERHLAETEALRADVERLQVRACASVWVCDGVLGL